jgi:hypothetical protein
VSPIRIQLGGTSPDLRTAVLAAVAGQPDLLLVADTADEMDTLLEAGNCHADVVVVDLTDGTLPAMAERLVDEYPQLAVLGVDLAAGTGAVYRLRPYLDRFRDVAVIGLAATIRRGAAGTERDD